MVVVGLYFSFCYWLVAEAVSGIIKKNRNKRQNDSIENHYDSFDDSSILLKSFMTHSMTHFR